MFCCTSQVGLPTADIDCDLAQYADIVCGKLSTVAIIIVFFPILLYTEPKSLGPCWLYTIIINV